MTYEYHEIANVFPLIEGDEFKDLVSDIKRKGLQEPVILFEGKILDGRNRYRACLEAGLQPRYEEYRGSDPVGFVVSLNLHRRHLSSSQCGACAAEAEELYERFAQEAAERRRAAQNNATAEAVKEKIPEQATKGQARDEVARLFNTNPRYVQDAKKLKKENPEVFEQVKAGKVTISKVNQQRKREERMRQIAETAKQAKELTGMGKYAVIYADPPWQYEHVKTDNRAIENQYPTMTLDDICAMEVPEICTDDCTLFMWTTAPKLEEAFRVLAAWGFNYRTCAVWDKQKIGMGYYFRVQHELLLVGTKGNPPTPAENSRVSSVFTDPRGRHSEKPDTVRDVIDAMYPGLPKVELFSRVVKDGWNCWGNEAA